MAWQFYYTAKVMLAVYCPEDQPMASLHGTGSYIEVRAVLSDFTCSPLIRLSVDRQQSSLQRAGSAGCACHPLTTSGPTSTEATSWLGVVNSSQVEMSGGACSISSPSSGIRLNGPTKLAARG